MKKDLMITEAVIKTLIRQERIKEAIDICVKKGISAKRFGELTQITLSEKVRKLKI